MGIESTPHIPQPHRLTWHSLPAFVGKLVTDSGTDCQGSLWEFLLGNRLPPSQAGAPGSQPRQSRDGRRHSASLGPLCFQAGHPSSDLLSVAKEEQFPPLHCCFNQGLLCLENFTCLAPHPQVPHGRTQAPRGYQAVGGTRQDD